MPWEIVENDAECDGGWAVRKEDDGALEGCHATRDDALDQLAALNASETETEEMGAAFETILAIEGLDTDDSRVFELNAIEWREPPVSLMAMTEADHSNSMFGGGPVSKVAGRIEEIWRDPERPGVIRGRGHLTVSAFGREVEGLIRERSLQRVSVDATRRMSDMRVETISVSQEGAPVDEREVFSRAHLLGATVLPFSAFSPTHIWLEGMEEPSEAAAAEGGEVEPITDPAVVDVQVPSLLMSLTASNGGPLRPPREWFEVPEPDDGRWVPFTIEADGRCYGYVGPFDRCHVGQPGACKTAQRSSPGLPHYHVGRTECADGTHVATGPLTMDTIHPTDPYLSYEATLRHYSHTGTGVADLHCIDGNIGIWACGALRPGLTDRELRTLNGTHPSIDQRPIDRKLELAGILMVNQPGLPKPQWAVREGEQASLVAAAAVACDGELLAPEPLDLLRSAERQTETLQVDLEAVVASEALALIGAKLDSLETLLRFAVGSQAVEALNARMAQHLAARPDGDTRRAVIPKV